MPEPALGVDVSRAAGRARELFVQAARDAGEVVAVRHEGRVTAVGDGLVRLSGLDDAEFGGVIDVGGVPALTVELAHGVATAALLAAGHEIARVASGDRALAALDSLSIGVGEALVGRVVDALGRPLDGRPAASVSTRMPLEREAPAIFERDAVVDPVYTGVLSVDALFPIGRGQRELIVGDEGSGRTSLCVDALLNQRDSDLTCIYAGVGQRRSETWQIAHKLERAGVRFVIVAAAEDESPALRVLAPYAATAIGEYYRDRGRHALVVYDDLSAHARAWRELSLLLRRPPGREAYPGDVFYLHSRLLERSAQLSAESGGGSLTALPVATLESGRLTAFIPTNLVSITDGQLVTSARLFAAGHKPAIDAGLSVSRVGAKAQSSLFSSLSGQLRLTYASFLELESFARLGTRLEADAERRLAVGRRLRALLTGQNDSPLGLTETAVRLAMARREDWLLEVAPEHVVERCRQVATHLLDVRPEIEREVLDAAIAPGRLEQLVASALGVGGQTAPAAPEQGAVDERG